MSYINNHKKKIIFNGGKHDIHISYSRISKFAHSVPYKTFYTDKQFSKKFGRIFISKVFATSICTLSWKSQLLLTLWNVSVTWLMQWPFKCKQNGLLEISNPFALISTWNKSLSNVIFYWLRARLSFTLCWMSVSFTLISADSKVSPH